MIGSKKKKNLEMELGNWNVFSELDMEIWNGWRTWKLGTGPIVYAVPIGCPITFLAACDPTSFPIRSVSVQNMGDTIGYSTMLVCKNVHLIALVQNNLYLVVHPTNRGSGLVHPSYKWTLPPLIPFITRLITHLLSGMNHQVGCHVVVDFRVPFCVLLECCD